MQNGCKYALYCLYDKCGLDNSWVIGKMLPSGNSGAIIIQGCVPLQLGSLLEQQSAGWPTSKKEAY